MIETRIDQERGCGWRKEGGLYLVSGSLSRGCGKLPIPLTVCPCCHGGIKPTRGFQWVGYDLIKDAPCFNLAMSNGSHTECNGCVPFNGSVQRFGLIWVGGKFYKTADDFMNESAAQGISRRISAVPKDFVVGESWVLLAHRQCIPNEKYPKIGDKVEINGVTQGSFGNEWRLREIKAEMSTVVRGQNVEFKEVWNKDMPAFNEPPFIPGIFQAFQPTAIEYVVKGTETTEEIEAMEKRGITCVKIDRELKRLESEPLKRDENGYLATEGQQTSPGTTILFGDTEAPELTDDLH